MCARKTKGGLGLIDNQRISKDLLTDYCRNLLENNTPVTWEEMKSMLSDKLGLWGAIPLDEKTTESLHNTFNRTFIERSWSKVFHRLTDTAVKRLCDDVIAWLRISAWVCRYCCLRR